MLGVGLSFALIVASPSFAQPARTVDSKNSATLTFVSLGQGDGAVLRTPTGRTVIIDAGPDPTPMAQWLAKHGVTTIDLAVASHNHADHIGGMPEVFKHFPVTNYMENGVPATTVIYRRTLDAIAKRGTRGFRAEARVLKIDGVAIEVLPMPPESMRGSDQNDRSIGLLITYGGTRVLLTGDSEEAEQDWWLKNPSVKLAPVTILKAAHHGSHNGTSNAWMDRLAPKAVVISLSANNTYGHPHRPMLEMLRVRGLAPWRTDQVGDITVIMPLTGATQIQSERSRGLIDPYQPGTSASSRSFRSSRPSRR